MTLLLDTALKGSILILAAALVAYFLRGKSAAARHAAWTAAVIGHLAIPAFALVLPHWKLPLLSAPAWMATRVSDIAPVTRTIDEATPVTQPASPAPVSGKVESPAPTASSTNTAATIKWSSLSVVAVLWIAGATMVLLRLAVGTWKVGRLAKNGDRVDDGEWLSLTQRLANRLDITRPLTLLRGDKLAVPVTWGVVYPAVLLPPDSVQWPEERRRFVLVHEMAHVKRFDALTQLLAQIAIAIFWFDPLIWLAAHRMRVEREHACDDYVLRDGTKPSLYAGELLEMVQSIGLPRHERAAPAFAALAMARRSEFEGRMLSILDARQDRRTLGRKTAVTATAALALLVLPLAALRPFEKSDAPAKKTVASSVASPTTTAKPKGPVREILDYSCDSAMRAPVKQDLQHVHVEIDDNGDDKNNVVEFMFTHQASCSQAAIIGETKFANDRLISLGDDSYITLKEITPSLQRSMKITRRENGTMEFAPMINGRPVPFDDSMRSWLGRFLPDVLTEASIGVPERVARDVARGGVDAALDRISHITSTLSKKNHYEALLDMKPLSEAEYKRISRHASLTLASSPTDLGEVLARIAAGPAKGTKGLGPAVARLGQAQQALANALNNTLDRNKSSRDSASTLTQYGVTDDPDMMLMALQGAKELSSDTDRRILLQTLAAGSLRRKDASLRKAFFDATETFTSDTDLRVVLVAALPYGHADPLVTSSVLRVVGDRLSSDTEKRIVLVTAVEQRLIKNEAQRKEFMTAAKTMSSDDEYRVVMQAAFKQ
jgi:beta-lactamase regulating signal transducer with metallopeptidase domain